MPTARFISNKNGLTLVEALVAVLILGTGLLSVGTAIGTQFSFINQNRENTLAILAAQEVIEHTRSMAFDDIINTDLNAKFNNANDSRPQGFTYLTSPTAVINTYDHVYDAQSNIQRISISVTISWISSNGKTLRQRLSTLVTRNGMDNK